MSQIATLTFDLADPEAKYAFNLAVKAPDMLSALLEYERYLHDQYKYQDAESQDDIYDIRKKFYEVMLEHSINLHE
jgi:hypothetical protein